VAALIQCIATAIGLFGLVADDVRQGGLGNFPGEAGDVCPMNGG